MNRTSQRLAYWVPRALGIAFAVFVSLFALDAFSQNLPLVQELAAFVMHLLPTAIVLLLLAFAWKHEGAGGAAFIAVGLVYLWITWLEFALFVDLLISGPAILVGLLFVADSLLRRNARRASA